MNSFLFADLKAYSTERFRRDFVAALVVTAIAIPESLGFAAIVGLPVQTGLYCALLAPVIFALFTASRYLVIGADSATAALVAAGASSVALVGTAAYSNAVMILGLVTAATLVLMSLLRFGFFADLISRPVFIGFLAGIGVQLTLGKLPDMLGLHIHGSLLHKLDFILTHRMDISLLTLFVSLAIVAIVLVANRRGLPGALIGLVAAIAISAALQLEQYGLVMVGAISAGLPAVPTPHSNLSMVITLAPTAAAIALVILAQSTATIRNFASKHDEPTDDNRDLLALGLANAASALTHGFAVNGSPPRTIASEQNGGRTQMVNVYMAGLIALTLLFAAPLLRVMPMAALAAIVCTIGLHLIDISQLRAIWKVRRAEFAVALLSLLGVAILGVQRGVILAIIISIVERLQRQYRPEDSVLLRDQKLAKWAESRLDPHHKHRSAPAGMLVYRFGGSIFFENTSYFIDRITQAIQKTHQPLQTVIIDAGAINDIDFTAAEAIRRLAHKLNVDDIQLGFAHVPPHLQELLERYHLLELIGRKNIYPTLSAAIEAHPHSRRSAVEMVQRLGLPQGSYVIIGGGVLEALGLRETNDVDLVVSKELYQQYRAKGWREYVQDDGKRVLSRNGYQLMMVYMGEKLSQLRTGSFEIDGVSFMSLEKLVVSKKRLGRPKDLADIALIQQHISKHKTR